MGLIINGDTQFFIDGKEIAKTDLNMVYLDIQWITPKGVDSVVKYQFNKYEDTDMTTPLNIDIDGIPSGRDSVDVTSIIVGLGNLMSLTVLDLHNAVISKLESDYPAFTGRISIYDPFIIP